MSDMFERSMRIAEEENRVLEDAPAEFWNWLSWVRAMGDSGSTLGLYDLWKSRS